jgi:chromosome segregation ATPase
MTSDNVEPKAAGHNRDDKWGGISFSGIAQSLMLAAVVFVATTMYQSSGKEADFSARIKSLDDKYSDLKATAVTKQELKSLEDKTGDLKTNEVSASAIENSLTTQSSEITNLRNQVASANSFDVKHEAEMATINTEIARLRASDESICEMIAKLRERLATLEANQKSQSPIK